MDWFYNKEITLLEETEGHMYHGSWVEGELKPIKTIICDVQPANREQIYKEYGYYIDCTKRIFTDLDNDLKLGRIVAYKETFYKIVKIIEWDDYLDIMLNEYEVASNG